jgi:hypothetical protein
MFIIFYFFPMFNFRMTRPSLGSMYHLLEDPITTASSLHRRYRQNLQASARLPRVFRIFGAFVVSLQRLLPTQPPPCPSSPQVLLFLTYLLACKPPLTIDKLVLHAGTPHRHARTDPSVTKLVLITAVAARAHYHKI